MEAINEHQMNASSEKEANGLLGNGYDPQDDTKVYVMHGFHNRVRVQYIEHTYATNNLD